MLVSDYLDNMIVTLATIVDSHECPEYRAGRYCARIAQLSSKKNEKLRFSSSGAGSVTSVTQWIGSESTQYEWGFEKGFSALATGFENSNRIHLRSLPRSRSYQVCRCAWITAKCCSGIISGCYFLHN